MQYKNFKFNSKQDFINYIEKRMTDYWKAHNDSFSKICEELDSWDGFLGDDRCYSMDELDDILGDKKPSEVLQMIDIDNFNYNDDFFYYDDDRICSTDKKEYFNDVDYSEVFEELIDDYGKIFNYHYGLLHAYYTLFDDVYDIINYYDEDEIQSCLNNGYYDYLFSDDDDFFWRDDLDD